MQYLPQADFLQFTLPQSHLILVTDDGSALTPAIIQQLEQQGHKTAILSLPNLANNKLQNSVPLAAVSDEAIQAALQKIRTQYGEIGSFIHIHPSFTFQNGNFTQHFTTETQIVKTVFLLAKHLQKPLNDLGQQQRANFMTVSQIDGKLGLNNPGNQSIIGGGLTGLVKSLNLEWSPVFCRALDLSPNLDTKIAAHQVLAEFHDADLTLVNVGFSKEGRKTIGTQTKKVAEQQQIETKVTTDSVFLVSGGARGVTATCVVEMAKTVQCKFILVGRSTNDFDLPDYAKADLDDSSLKRLIMQDIKAKGEVPSLKTVKALFKKITATKEINDTISKIEAHGGTAIYIAADVTKASSLKTKIATAIQQLGKITGIIHGAGRLADKLIQDKTSTDFDNVLSVKLDGLVSLLQCVDIHQLDHLILFSSVAGFYGNVGQTDYAIANEILSKAAHLFKKNHPNTHVSAINWGAWDAGMVSPALKKKFEEAGVSLIDSEGGAAMLVNELNTDYDNQPQVIIGSTLPMANSYLHADLKTYRIERHLQEADNPFLQHHVIQGKAVLPVVNAVGWMAQVCDRLYPDYQVFEVQNTKLFKGIVFDGTQPTDYIVEAKEVEKTAKQIVFEATVLSKGSKLPLYHYKATVVLRHKKAMLTAPNVKVNISPNFEPMNGNELYKNGALFHDSYFQGIQKILDWNEQQIVLACKAPNVPKSAQGQFPIDSVNTFFSDIQYQGMVIWVQKYKQGAKSLPLQTDSAKLYQPIPFEKDLLVHIAIVEHNDFKMVANCTVYDQAGKVYMVTTNAAVTVSNTLSW